MESLGAILRRVAARDAVPKPDAPPPSASLPPCEDCNGGGWIIIGAGLPRAADGERMVPCWCQATDADRQRRADALDRYSNFGRLRQAALDGEAPVAGRDFAVARDIAREYAEQPQGWLTFAGPSGSGKTWLMAAIVNYRVAAGQPVAFITAADLLDGLRAGRDDDAGASLADYSDRIRGAPLLALDDLPVHPTTPWEQEQLARLLAWRHSAGLPTVITLRGDPRRLTDFLLSRLASSDGFGRIVRLGRAGGVAGRGIGAIPARMRQRMTFDAFNPGGNGYLSDGERESLSRAQAYIRRWAERPAGWLYIHGAPGTGKTHLAVAAAAMRDDQGDAVIFATVADLLDALRATFAPDSPVAYDDLLDAIKTCDLLALDDLGAERNTAFAEDKLMQMVNYRYEAELPTIITTVQTPDTVAATRSRLASRLQDALLVAEVAIEAPDYRRGGRTGDFAPSPHSRG